VIAEARRPAHALPDGAGLDRAADQRRAGTPLLEGGGLAHRCWPVPGWRGNVDSGAV